MANNRLYLKCKRTGEKVMLAKYYPDTGWYSGLKGLRARMDAMFDNDKAGSMFDGSSHVLEYETDKEHL